MLKKGRGLAESSPKNVRYKMEYTQERYEQELVDMWLEQSPILFFKEAKDILGNDFTLREYHKKFCGYGNISDHVSVYDDISITPKGVLIDCASRLLSKKGLKEAIDLLIDYYANYEKYYQIYFDETKQHVISSCYQIKEDMEKANNDNIDGKGNKNGYIYVMLHQGYFKIGKSYDCTRLGEYTRLAEEPEYVVVEYVNDMDKIESMLHEMFADKRCRDGSCEWFALDTADISQIKSIVNSNKVPNVEHSKSYKKYVLKEKNLKEKKT